MNNIIECENLVKIYKTRDLEVLALQGLDLEVEYGELLALIGNSGSGKSTFLNMLGGLDRPSAGKLLVDGKNILKLTESDLVEYKRDTVGFVWQNNARNLIPYLAAIQNVQVPMQFSGKKRGNCENPDSRLSHDITARAQELLELVGLEKRKNSRLDQLSGGEQQRVAIAIALANEPKLLLADEPTGSVDLRTAARILEVFRKINNELGTTVIIVTHDRNMAKMVRRVVAIRDGKTSTEFIMKRGFERNLSDIAGFGHLEESTQDEFAVLDRAGRVQIPADILSQLNLGGGRKVKVAFEDGRVIITAP